MAELKILYWRDIPAEVVVGKGRKRSRGELSPRFAEAIDMAAMRSGGKDSESYLAGWRRGTGTDVADDPEVAVQTALKQIETDYPQSRLLALIEVGGHEGSTP